MKRPTVSWIMTLKGLRVIAATFGHTVRLLNSDSEATLLSTEVFLNTNSI